MTEEKVTDVTHELMDQLVEARSPMQVELIDKKLEVLGKIKEK